VAHRKVQLYKYLLLESGWRYCRAAFYENNRIKPHVVSTPQGEVTAKGGQYYLGFARKWESIGNDPAEAHRLLLKKRGELQVVANGGSVVMPPQQSRVSGTLRSALDAWLEEVRDSGKHQDTRVEPFPRCCNMSAIMEKLLSQARNASRDPTDCRRTIDRLRSMGFGEEAFAALHQQHGRMSTFYGYCGGVQRFREDDSNHRVHQRLKCVLLSCPDAKPPKGKSFQMLAEEAVKLIPFVHPQGR